MADPLRQALSQPARAPFGELCQTRDDTTRHRRGGILGSRLRERRAMHRASNPE